MSDDLPAWALRLGRMIVRDCPPPGLYEIRLERPPYPGEELEVSISRVERVRRTAIAQRTAKKFGTRKAKMGPAGNE